MKNKSNFLDKDFCRSLFAWCKVVGLGLVGLVLMGIPVVLRYSAWRSYFSVYEHTLLNALPYFIISFAVAVATLLSLMSQFSIKNVSFFVFFLAIVTFNVAQTPLDSTGIFSIGRIDTYSFIVMTAGGMVAWYVTYEKATKLLNKAKI